MKNSRIYNSILLMLWLVLIITYSSTAQQLQSKTASAEISGSSNFIENFASIQPMSQQELISRERNLRERLLGKGLEESTLSNTQFNSQLTQIATELSSAPLNVAISKVIPLDNLGTGGVTSTVGEPSVATRGNEILVTGNWFASFSSDGGATFSYINPSNMFPTVSGGFCCDQVALYDPSRDMMIWFLQYIANDVENTIRVAVASGNDIVNQQWRFYDFTPNGVGGWNNEWFDYPDLAISNDFLYITSNLFSIGANQFQRAAILRLPLDEMSTYQAFNFEFFDTTLNDSFRPTQGANQGVMYFGSHISTSQIRVFSWDESGTNINTNDINVQNWSNTLRTAPGPDGRDWLARCDSRITAGWSVGNKIGFGWTAAQDDNFPFPHVRFAVINTNTLLVTSQPHLWNSEFAFAYPSAAPNADGDIGIAVAVGGNRAFPSHAIGIYNEASSTWNMMTAKSGTNGPNRNVWGDYFAVRPHGSQPEKWVASGFTLQGGSDRTNIEPIYIEFHKRSNYNLSLISLDPDRRLSKGESVILRATLSQDGLPSVGQQIFFRSQDDKMASISDTEVTTDTNGMAEITVTGQTNKRTVVNIEANSTTEYKKIPVKVPDTSIYGILVIIISIVLMKWNGFEK